jgi:hypothetical protein
MLVKCFSNFSNVADLETAVNKYLDGLDTGLANERLAERGYDPIPERVVDIKYQAVWLRGENWEYDTIQYSAMIIYKP